MSNGTLNRNDIAWKVYANEVLTKLGAAMTFDSSGDISFTSGGSTTGLAKLVDGAFQIPVGISNERPSPGAWSAGMIRYLSPNNIIEYFSAGTNTWLPISQQAPDVTAITKFDGSPAFLVEPDGTDQSFNVSGANFVSGTSVSFIGQDATEYFDDATTFVSTGELISIWDSSNSIFDASLNAPFTTRVTIPSGLAGNLTDSVFWNDRPFFTNVSNDLGTIDSSQSVVGLLTDLSGFDPDGHYPLTFSLVGTALPGSIDLCGTTGAFSGSSPIVTGVTQTYNRNFQIEDTSGNLSFLRTFNLTVNGPYQFSTSATNGTIDISYYDTDGITQIASPTYGGFTLYQFKTTSNTTTASFTFEPTSSSFYEPCEVLIVGGGGGGGSCAGGGGGGGFVDGYGYFQQQSYSIQVGAGGAGGSFATDAAGSNGANSYIDSVIAYGGGGGAALQATVAGSGGCGGGGGYDVNQGGRGNRPGVQGFNGGDGNDRLGGGNYPGGGGGGAGGLGGNVTSASVGPNGGIGRYSSLTGQAVGYAGGAGASTLAGGTAGFGGGGAANPFGAADGRANSTSTGIQGTQHRGGGGGPGSSTDFNSSTRSGGGAGGSGIVMIKTPSYPLHSSLNYLNVTPSLVYDISYLDSGYSVVNAPVSDGYTLYTFESGLGTVIPSFIQDASYLIVGGGGGGGTSNIEDRGAGGGGGGMLIVGNISLSSDLSYSVLAGNGGTKGNMQVTSGGASFPNNGDGEPGANSSFNGQVAYGGGYGAGDFGFAAGGDGASGGGSRNGGTAGSALIVGTTGYDGGTGSGSGGGGGGMAGAGSNGATNGGAGGAGVSWNITGSAISYGAGGGGGGQGSGTGGAGGSGTGGDGGDGYSTSSQVNNGGKLGQDATSNTGSGGGGGGSQTVNTSERGSSGGNGSNGVVILRFPSFGTNVNPLNLFSFTPTNGTVEISYVDSGNSVVPMPSAGGATIYKLLVTDQQTTASFIVRNAVNIPFVSTLMVGGGGGGGNKRGGGGGAGGYILSALKDFFAPGARTIQVGSGGLGGTGLVTSGTLAETGDDSYITDGVTTYTAAGGSGGSQQDTPGAASVATDGGSGGGGTEWVPGSNAGDSDAAGQGYQGGFGGSNSAGGGGGAAGVGLHGDYDGSAPYAAGNGGSGLTSDITGSGASITFSGGGGGGSNDQAGSGGSSIGGNGASGSNAGSSAVINTGSGGGGSGSSTSAGQYGGSGSAGFVILRVPTYSASLGDYNSLTPSTSTNGIMRIRFVDSGNNMSYVPVAGGYTIYSFYTDNQSSNATFEVNPDFDLTSGNVSMDFLVIGGGGSGGKGASGGGGGAGGVATSYTNSLSSAFSPTRDSSPYSVSDSSVIAMTLGRGGINGGSSSAQNGFASSVTYNGTTREGLGGGGAAKNLDGGNGGSGGGIGLRNAGGYTPGSGVQFTSNGYGYGNNGGNIETSGNPRGAGGGGAGGVGEFGGYGTLGGGGIGIQTAIDGQLKYYAGGGGGAGRGDVGVIPSDYGGLGGAGGGGYTQDGLNGAAGTGSGGGGGGYNTADGIGGNGGSGVIILRFPSYS